MSHAAGSVYGWAHAEACRLVDLAAKQLGVARPPRVAWFDDRDAPPHPTDRVLAFVRCSEDHAIVHLHRELEGDDVLLEFYVRHEVRHINLHRRDPWRCDMAEFNLGEEVLCNAFATRRRQWEIAE